MTDRNKMIDIRMATEDDIPRILEIENDAFTPPWPHGALLSEIINKATCFLVATSNATVLHGFAILRQVGDESELFQIAVDKPVRGNGIADTLLDAVLSWVRERGVKKIFLEARVGNAAAISLYNKHRFNTVGRRKGYFTQPVEDAIIMTIEL